MKELNLQIGQKLYLRDELFEIIALRHELVVVKSQERSELSWVVAKRDLLKYFRDCEVSSY
ncbi:hypothetical protein L3556_07125 [Candidatus Synechococcus calcipolaris G9]|uniref:Uncharacterized protein n=1 Tax=Candidatus Synechococcus calcipolaris G9 TaxID=1497997 RepID=A0ABT6EY19_9SYNE|nr:hypothetical protein [Candidatus Synechococcus calcipolaris]MDG2990705.1 hypothetical protein [Candidatus Synechococcus calcipolaris G9]